MTAEVLTPSNAPHLVDMFQVLWDDCDEFEAKRLCQEIMEFDQYQYLLKKKVTEYLGFIYLLIWTDYVEGIYVKPQFRQSGCGRFLPHLIKQ